MNLTDIPNLTNNGDNTWTLTGGLDGRTWTIRKVGERHYLADLDTWSPDGGEPGLFSGSFRAVLWNCGGPLLDKDVNP